MQLRIEGKHAAMMMELLKSWQLTDGNGIENDSLSMTLFSENVEGIPAKGEKYQVYIGNTYRDEFQISKRSISLRPSEVRLVLCVAPFNILDSTGYRERKSSSWDNATISQIVSDCVAPHGFTVFVHPELQNIQIGAYRPHGGKYRCLHLPFGQNVRCGSKDCGWHVCDST